MLDIVCTRKEKTRVFLFFETYKMVFLLLQSETSCYHMLLSNVFMFRQSCTQDRCVSRLFLWLDALFLLSTTEIFIVVLPFFFYFIFFTPSDPYSHPDRSSLHSKWIIELLLKYSVCQLRYTALINVSHSFIYYSYFLFKIFIIFLFLLIFFNYHLYLILHYFNFFMLFIFLIVFIYLYYYVSGITLTSV